MPELTMMNSQQDSNNVLQIYSNLLKAAQTYFFLSGIESGGIDASREFLKKLINGNTVTPLSPNLESIESLRHFYFESRNQERLVGTNTLALGFPLLIIPGETLKVQPLFIWKLEMEPMGPKPDSWVFRLGNKPGFTLNPVILEALSADDQKDWEKLIPFSKSSLDQKLAEISKSLNASIPDDIEHLEPLPVLAELLEETEGHKIIAEAVFGLFPTVHLNPLTPFPPNKKHDGFSNLGLPYFQENQLEIFEKLHAYEEQLITSEFPERLQDLCIQLLSNLLLNKKSVLIVSDRVARLEQLQSKLGKHQLESLAAIIRNPEVDRAVISHLIQKGPTPLPDLNDQGEKFDVLKTRYDQQFLQLKKQFSFLKGPYLEKWSWKELCGRFLRSQKQEGRELLDRYLDSANFEWTSEEHQYLIQVITNSESLFHPVGTLRHPLGRIHSNVFLDQDRDTAQATATAGLSSWKKKLEQLHYQLLEMTDSYSLQLTDLYQKEFLTLRNGTQQVLDLLEEHISKFGKDGWDRPIPKGLSGVFSKEKKEIRQSLGNIIKLCEKLEIQRESNKLIPHPLPTSFKKVREIQEQILQYKSELSQWRSRLSELVEEEVQRFSSSNIHPGLQHKTNPYSQEVEMDEFIQTINESKWLEKSLEHRLFSLPQRQKHLEQIMESLDTIQINLRDFHPFYDWQRHWLSLSNTGKLLIEALVKVKPDNWIAAFESWYFHRLMHQQKTERLPVQVTILNKLQKTAKKIENYIPTQIRKSWNDQYQKDFKRVKSKNRKLFSQLGKPEIPFHLILRDLGPLLNSRFPILMATSEQAISCLKSRHSGFDTCMVWDSTNINSETIQSLKLLSSQFIHLKEGLPTENGISLDRESSLQNSPWRNRKNNILDWSITKVHGASNPDLRINDSEARLVIQLLNKIEPTPQRTFPKTGIVGFTKAQRNRIASYLLEIKQSKSNGFVKIQQLERNGLTVLSLEELAGQDFDQLIYSTQVGNNKKELEAFTYWLSQPEASKQIRTLLHFDHLTLLHSIPDEFFSDIDSPGKETLFQILSLAEALQDNNPERTAQIKENLFTSTPLTIKEHSFEESIKDQLSRELNAERIDLFVRKGETTIPILIKSENDLASDLILLPDLFWSKEASTSFHLEAKIWEEIKSMNLKVLPIWSLDWWRNPEIERRNLLRKIKAHFAPPLLDSIQEEE